MLDIASLAAADSAAIHLKDAKGDPLYDDGKPVRIHVYGPGSQAYATVDGRQTSRAVKRMRDNDGKVTAATPSEQTADQAEDLASITTAFENFAYSPAGDKQGVELFRAVYADKALGFVTRQVAKFVQDWANFTSASVAT